jgi:phage tail-like protein
VTLTATAHPAGNRIVVRWSGPEHARFRLLCRRGTYPTPADWNRQPVADATTTAPVLTRTTDGFVVTHEGLAAETVHYYQLLVPDPAAPADPQRWVGDPIDRAAAMATGPYQFADRLYRLLPAVHRRFDTALPPADAEVPVSLRDQGQLRRFLDLVGGPLDQTYSTVRSLAGLTDVARVDGRLLPLLAHWVGWRLDQGLELDEQRRQIADAPAVYERAQTLAALTAAASRLTGWPCTAKEMVDNVAVTNRPEQLNLWWHPPADTPDTKPELLSTDAAGEGRPAVVAHPDGTVRMVYGTTKNGRGELWEKVLGTDGTWTPSRPVVTGPDSYQDPAAALTDDPADGTVLLAWSAHRPGTGWRIEFRQLVGGAWGPVQGFAAGDGAQRRDPAMAVDTSDAAAAVLWLFWREQGTDGRWRLRYRRGMTPGPDRIRDFPRDGNADPGVDARTSAAVLGGKVWLWWAQLTPHTAAGPTRWRCVFRVKDTTTDDGAGWGPVTALGAPDQAHDREPLGHVTAAGALTVLFSSTRDGSWSVWQVPVDVQNRTWGAPAAVTAAGFTDRSPAVLPLAPAVLVYRSSRSITRLARHGRSGASVDRRPSGTVTVRAGNTARLAQRGTVDDLLTYTVRVGPFDDQVLRRERLDLVAFDVVALLLDPGTAGPEAVDAGVARLRAVLPEFLPITTRAVLITGGPA